MADPVRPRRQQEDHLAAAYGHFPEGDMSDIYRHAIFYGRPLVTADQLEYARQMRDDPWQGPRH